MILYTYDRETGEYTGSREARSNPAFGEDAQPEFLIPALSTAIQPAAPGANQAAVFHGGAWVLAPDFRGITGYDAAGAAVIVAVLGKTLADLGLTESAPTLPPTVPAAIAMDQARIALFNAGLLNAVQPAIDALPEPAKTKANIQWEYSSSVQRHNGFVEQLAPALGLSSAQLDALFIQGAAL